MSATYLGLSGLVTDISYKQQNDGIVEYTKRILYHGNQTSISVPSIGDNIDGFLCVGVSLVKTDGAFIEVNLRGESSGNGGGGGGFSSGALLRDATSSTAEEPIETAINFQTATAGLPSIVDSSGGAYTQGSGEEILGYAAAFSEDGLFIGFNKNAQKNFFGVKSYLSPTLSYKRNFSSQTKPSISAVGRIVNPAGDFPDIESGRTWLCMSISYTKRGNSYEVSQEFRGSDRGGWNNYIYGPAISAPSYS